MNPWLHLIGGGFLLYFGAEWFVGGAAALAMALSIPRLFIGLTVVAYGTSAPEVIVGIQAAAIDHGIVALGNVIGSNIANIGLVLGITALVKPPSVEASFFRREIPMLLLGTALLPLMLLNGVVAVWEGIVLLAIATGYTAWMIRTAQSSSLVDEAKADARATHEAADTAGSPKAMGPWRAVGTATVGLFILLVGANGFVDGAVTIAYRLGISEHLVGLTIVAVGTSLPEIVTSVIAARKGHADIAVGNVLGSNICNTFICLGSSALVGNVGAPFGSIAFDLVSLTMFTGIASVYMREKRTISRREGGIVVALYLVYTIITILRG